MRKLDGEGKSNVGVGLQKKLQLLSTYIHHVLCQAPAIYYLIESLNKVGRHINISTYR